MKEDTPFPVTVDRDGLFRHAPVDGHSDLDSMLASGYVVTCQDYGSDREGWRVWVRKEK